jgi:hypothetical protein
MATKYLAGNSVPSGYYWNPKKWSVTPVAKDGDVLPGEAGEKFVKVSLPLAIAAAPVLGGLFVVFLPFIGFGLTAYALANKLAGGAKKSAAELASTVTPGWRPGEAHLTGKPGETSEKEVPAHSEAMEDLAKEIQDKRSGE